MVNHNTGDSVSSNKSFPSEVQLNAMQRDILTNYQDRPSVEIANWRIGHT